ncbi:amidohydrolase [Sphingomonas gilva]|uniref:Amidohydrolase n=1 Tax=Sphingomonas gilva TaxID=2305907 RepID=A0A396S0C5_9SPHN|nr:amidohydrolase [Sphingomonas gilva]
MIDAHHHIWSLARPECRWPTAADGVLHRDFTLVEFRRVAGDAGVSGAVLIQTQESDADTDWLLTLADDPFVTAVVGWADLHAPHAPRRIAALARHPKLAGLRPMVQHRAADWYDDPALDAAFDAMEEAGLALDALVRVGHLASLERLARRRPDLAIAIDHAAKPAIGRSDGFAEWRRAIAPLADRPNMRCKLSGLLSECGDAPPEAVVPFILAMLELFGADRVMWGSDWPVLEASGRYADWLALARATVPERDHRAVFGGTARAFYATEAVEVRA